VSQPVLLSLVCALLCAVNDILYKRTASADTGGKYAFYCMSSFFSLAFFLIFCLFKSGIVFDTVNIVFGILAGILSFFAYMFFLQSFGSGNTVLTVTIFRLNLIPGIILAIIFLSEELSLRRTLAVILCVISIFLLMAGKNKGSFSIKNIRTVFLILSVAACLIAGLLNLINKTSVMRGGDPVQILLWRFLVVSLLSLVPFYLYRPNASDSAKTGIKRISISAASGILVALLNLCALIALTTGDLGLVVPITQMAFVPVSLFSWIALKEKVDPVKIAGFVCAVFSIFLIT